MAIYTLPTTTSVSGLIQIVITSDVAGLTVPTFDTILSVGPKVEKLSEELGANELSTLEVIVRDDTSTHTQGFWYRLLDEASSFEMKVSILEDGAYKPFFIGILSQEEVIWDEKYITAPRIRTCSFTLIDISARFFDINMADFINDVYDYSTLFDCNPGEGVSTNWKYIIPLSTILGVALKTAGLNPVVNSAEFVFDPSSPDMNFIDASLNEFGLSEVYIPTAYWNIRTTYKHDYWNTASDNSLEQLYGGNFKAFLGDFLFNFGLYLRIVYSGSLYYAYLYQRYGRAYAATITLGSEMESELTRSSPLKIVGAKCENKLDPDSIYWFHKNRAPDGTDDAIPTNIDFEISRGLLWTAPDISGGSYQNAGTIGVLASAPYSGVVQAVDFEYFDSVAAAMQATTATSQTERMQHAIAGYNFKALTLQNKSFRRRYSGITATTGGNESFQNLNVLRRTDIADGTATETYYANNITTDLNKYSTEIEWIRETALTV